MPEQVVSTGYRSAVDVRRFPWIRRLAADYAFDFNRLAPFFAGNPVDAGAWEATIARVQAAPHDRHAVASLLGRQQRARGAPPTAMAASERLGEKGSIAIVTGQQAGLFGGPVYTLLKALTAVKLAERIRRDHGIPAVAIFWVEAEDHDWNEIAACSVLDEELERRTITLDPPAGAGTVPVASVRLDAGVVTAIDELGSLLPPTEFTATCLTQLRLAYRTGAGTVEAFARWLETTLGDLGLVVYDSSDPAAKPLVQGVFSRELEWPGHTAGLAAVQGQELVALGYHAQVVAHEDHVALFHLDGHREPIRHGGDGFTVGGTSRAAEQLREEVRRNPEAFSPNVLLRPIVQDTLFPTAAYIAGPNELAYLAQLRPVYEHFGVPMPLMVPRASVTLLDSAGAKFISRYDVPLELLAPDDEAALNRLLEAHLPAGVEESFQAARASLSERMQAVIDAVPAIDPTLEGAARSALGRMEHEFETLHGKMLHAAKRRDETLRRQFRRTRAQAFPGGEPQERSIGWVYFLNRYGPALVERLAVDLPVDVGRHWILTI